MKEVTNETQLVALIGYPLRRPHSAVMHNAAFHHFGIDAHYQLRPLPGEDLDPFFKEARTPRWLGFQVTSPYKQEALARCDAVAGEAKAIGAVNTAQVEGGRVTGYNTDVGGFLASLRFHLGLDPAGLRVVIAGGGGAARAVVYGCLHAGAEQVTVGTRQLPSALVEEFASPRLAGVALGSTGFEAALDRAHLAVNATTVGMTSIGPPFDVGRLPDGAAVFDLVYVPPETQLLAEARGRGLAAVGGGGMLIQQAALAFALWTGISTAAPVMGAAVAPLLSDSRQAEVPGE